MTGDKQEELGTCGDCRFWDRLEDDTGLCRRLAPRAIRDASDIEDLWPRTILEDWCGEWVKARDK